VRWPLAWELVEWNELVGELEDCCSSVLVSCCSQLGTVREPRGRGTSAVGSRYQKTGEDIAS
jgi:hypothetical protein